jgi:cell pole-organizing protein PopZ
MEDILASIRRIISEDEPPPAPVLELKEPVRETAAPARAQDMDDLLVFDEDQPEDIGWAAEPAPAAPAPPKAPQRAAVEPDLDLEPIVSEPAITAAAHAFTRLAGTIRLSEQAGQTLEGVVREMLRPLLRDWLDHHLPAIVEAKVEAELDRISRMAR